MTTTELAQHDLPLGAPSSLPQRGFINDMPDRGLFGITAFVGFFLIFGLKQYNINEDWITAGAILIMIAYGAIAYRIPEVSMRADRLGDNFYYMGFIFTLASLSSALFKLRSGVEIEPLLGSFGIALITTIFGIAGRVVFAQMRGSLDEVEEIARRNLAEASARLKAELSSSIREFETLRTAMAQTVTETTSALDSTLREQVRVFERVNQEVSIHSQSLTRGIESHFSSIKGAADGLVSSVETLRDKTEKMRVPSEALNAELEVFSRRLTEEISRLTNAVNIAVVEIGRGHRRRWWWFRRWFRT